MPADHNYWRSLRELYDGHSINEQKAHEFMAGVTDEFRLSDLHTMSRKQFLALLSASAAFAAAGCSNYRDNGEIVPYTRKPEEIIPGVANHYASTCTGCAQACGILIKTREGRPIKVDGNPDHPINQGKICAKGQASILNLYDPYRLHAPQHGTGSGLTGDLTWKTADADAARIFAEAVKNGKEIAIVTHAVTSPTTKKLLKDFAARFPTTRIYSYELFSNTNRRRAWEKCYGNANPAIVDWHSAEVIVALESDFLGTDGMVMEQVREFTGRRDIMKSPKFNRLYSIEGSMSLTGANADYRLRLRPDAQLGFVLAVLNEILVVRRAIANGKKIGNLIAAASLAEFAAAHGMSPDILRVLVDDLLANRGKALVHAGDLLPESVHIAVNYLNELLGNTLLYKRGEADTAISVSAPDEFSELVSRMKSGAVGAVIHFGTNPAYHLPAQMKYAEALPAVSFSVSLAEAEDETARLCTHVLPSHHAFESWGDHQVRTGLLSLQQPVIAPLYNTRQREAVLLSWISGPDAYRETIYHEFLMNRWEKEVYPASGATAKFKAYWYSALHDGVTTIRESVPSAGRTSSTFKSDVFDSLSVIPPSGFAVLCIEPYYLGDGRFANNGWLQELPHPISKVVWDNYAAIAPKTAKALGVETGDSVDVRTKGGTIQVPVLLQPGQAEETLSIAMGYGRTNAGPIGTAVGVDISALLPVNGARILTAVNVTKGSGSRVIVSTQEHHALDDEFTKELHLKRKIIREGTLAEYGRDPNFIRKEKTESFSIAKEINYDGVKWAMSIDLNKCTGCNACVVGCNVENNIPVVGKEQVANGREMHWIRIDRYYAGTDAAPALSHQPMLCQHCDNAPCENVCPVVATNHSPDGLNQMVYNRCVGTKYCSNNCPYKVRRFNFFNWRDHFADGYYDEGSTSLLHNPEVTVRSRGVMEKCTFCIQRIMEARQHATEQGRAIAGNDVKTACQEACPATAIVFGDMNDPKSEVSRYRSHALGYHVLEETNARPNVTYVARLRNVEG